MKIKLATIAAVMLMAAGVFGAGPLAPHDAQWLRGKVGVMVHWLYPSYGDADRWADGFDVKAFLSDFESTGAEWLIFTAGQCRGVYASPSKRLEAYCGPGHSTRRDLLSEIAHGVKGMGRRFIVYSAVDFVNDGCDDHSMQRGLCWYTNSNDRAEFQRRWSSVLGGWAERLGPDIDGWWLDGAGEYKEQVAEGVWAKALRAGNPRAIWTFNMGVYDMTWRYGAHYTAGEVTCFMSLKPSDMDPAMPPTVVTHYLFPIDGYWGGFWKWPAADWTRATFRKTRPDLFDETIMEDRLARREFPDPFCTEVQLRAFLDGVRRRGEAATVNVGISPDGRLNPKSIKMLNNILKK